MLNPMQKPIFLGGIVLVKCLGLPSFDNFQEHSYKKIYPKFVNYELSDGSRYYLLLPVPTPIAIGVPHLVKYIVTARCSNLCILV